MGCRGSCPEVERVLQAQAGLQSLPAALLALQLELLLFNRGTEQPF